MKKFLSILLALALVLALSVPALAADKNDKITVTGAKPGETYDLYKLFDLSVNSETDPTAYTYTINADWAAFFAAATDNEEAGPGNQYITVNAAGAVTAISDAAALAKAAAEWSGKPSSPVKSVTVAENGTSAVFSGLEDGYWLITSTLGTIAMTETTPDKSAVEVEEKNPEDTIEKEVKEDSTGTYGESNDAQIGDTVEFQSTVKIVKGTRNVVVHDKMTDGLTYTASSVAIAGLTKGTEYTVNESPDDGDTFDITFDQDWIDELDFGNAGYKEYVITYTAVINDKAVVTDENGTAIVDQNNKTHVSYGDGTDSTEDSTTTETHKFSVLKYATGKKDENLADAVFQLKKNGTVVNLVKIDDLNYRVATAAEVTGATVASHVSNNELTTVAAGSVVSDFVTVDSGNIVIWGVDSDNDYTLAEILPPAGYNELTEEVSVTVNADNSTVAEVENKAGTELPSTGGIGTTIFYIVGGVMLIGAAVLLISKKRMQQE